MLDCDHREIGHLHDKIGRYDPVSSGIGTVAGFAEMGKERGSGLQAFLMTLLRAGARSQYRDDPDQGNPREAGRAGPTGMHEDAALLARARIWHCARVMNFPAAVAQYDSP